MKPYHLWIFIIFLLTSCTSLEKKESNESSQSAPPKLLKPVIKKIWIPPEIRNGGGEWIEGHYLYRIERDTSWSR